MSGTLFVVATPIGNLEDLTPRARQTLAEVDLIAAEDTRHTGRLLLHLGLKTRLLALHEHNEEAVVDKVLGVLLDGQNVALVSDAGTPLVSDPGYRLVRAAHQRHCSVSPIPGPSAVTAALSAAGLPTDRFCFEGFLPSKQAARRKLLASLASETRTLVFFESVHRIAVALADLSDAFGEHRAAFVGRELSKLHEQCVQASLGELRERLADGEIVSKGEFVIVIAGAPVEARESSHWGELLAVLAGELPAKQAAAIAARITGEKKNALYAKILDLRQPDDEA